ncbi:hypothetical protein CDAR_586091 [Caerostris darwini]|uniref:Prolactin receptor n=1 Tax=Caerostris darwini TaxID=1538125 RepID=A0AAV4UWB1_9ARAC|nr:hypothetical protein CDAR_586091 [Caerostris darwini]
MSLHIKLSPPEDDQEKFPTKVSNASANLWSKRVLNSTEASNFHSSGTHSVSGNDETNPLHEWPSLQPKLHPLKLSLGNAPLSPAFIHWTESSHPTEGDQEKFPTKVNNVSTNLWPSMPLTALRPVIPIPPRRTVSQETTKRIPYANGHPPSLNYTP